MKAVSLLLTTLASADNNFGNTPKPGLCPEGIPDQPNFDRERYVEVPLRVALRMLFSVGLHILVGVDFKTFQPLLGTFYMKIYIFLIILLNFR